MDNINELDPIMTYGYFKKEISNSQLILEMNSSMSTLSLNLNGSDVESMFYQSLSFDAFFDANVSGVTLRFWNSGGWSSMNIAPKTANTWNNYSFILTNNTDWIGGIDRVALEFMGGFNMKVDDIKLNAHDSVNTNIFSINIPGNAIIVTNGQTVGSSAGGAFVYVKNGGTFFSGSGSLTVVIEPTGRVTGVGGSCTIIMKSGAYFYEYGSGSETVYYESGAQIDCPSISASNEFCHINIIE